MILDGFAVRVPGVAPPAVVPVPETATVAVVVVLVEDAFLCPLPCRGTVATREIVPLSVLLDGGANVTLKIALCPAGSVSGRFTPLRLKPVALTVA